MTRQKAVLWNVLLITRGGVASLLKRLTETEAREVLEGSGAYSDPWSEDRIVDDIRRRIDPDYRPGHAPRVRKSWKYKNHGKIKTAQAFRVDGKEGDLLIFQKPEDYDARYQAFLGRMYAALESRGVSPRTTPIREWRYEKDAPDGRIVESFPPADPRPVSERRPVPVLEPVPVLGKDPVLPREGLFARLRGRLLRGH